MSAEAPDPIPEDDLPETLLHVPLELPPETPLVLGEEPPEQAPTLLEQPVTRAPSIEPYSSHAQAPTVLEPASGPRGGSLTLGDAPTVAPHGPPTGSSGALLRSGRGEGGVGDGTVPTFAGKYELLSEIARGGMGVVYKARQVDLNRLVALKVMLAGSMASEEEQRRFIIEAEASARLQHPNIVPVYDIGESEKKLFFTMDFVDGTPLSARKSELDREQLLDVMIKIADGVAYAHQRGIIHRDLKPANVMMTRQDEPRIMDFGLAKQVELEEEGGSSFRTLEGSVMGTPHYMPPEQAEGAISEIDVRADVYALGVILYELFTGQLPFTGRSVSELLLKIFDTDPTPPRRLDPTIDPDLEAITLKCLEKQKSKRYESALELKRELERLRDGLPVNARRATPLYRLKKWSRRNRTGLSVGAVFVALVVLFVGVQVDQTLKERRRLASERDAAVRTAEEGAAPLEAEATGLRGEIATLRAAEFQLEPRREGAAALRARVEQLTARLDLIRGPVLEYRDHPAAVLAAERLAALARDLEQAAGALAAMAQVDQAIVDTISRAAELATLAAQVGGGELSGQATDAVLTRAAATANCQALLADDALDEAGGDDPAYAAFMELLPKVQLGLFTALGLAGDGGKARAGALLGDLADLEAQVEQARARQAGRHLALSCRQAADALLAGSHEAELTGEEQLRDARLAQAVVERGLEGDPELEALKAVRLQANRAYAEALLALKAYLVLGVELEREGAFTPSDGAALRERLTLALQQVELIRKELLGLAPDAAVQLDPSETERRLARLRELETPTLPPELEALRKRVAEQLEAAGGLARQRIALQRVQAARARADEARGEASSPALLAERQAGIAAAYERARDLYLELAPDLGQETSTQGARECELALARLEHDAAQSLERSDGALALRLARRALGRYQSLRAQGLALPESTEEALADYVSRLQRLGEKPEGMVLLPGGSNLELGSANPGDRNPLRAVALSPFYLAEQEVACGDYAEFLQSPEYGRDEFWAALNVRREQVPPLPEGWSGTTPPAGLDALPITGISWNEARGYAQFRGRRLPSDDEWEYAARYQADDARPPGRVYPWGDVWLPDLLPRTLGPPGENPADRTPSGLADMGGNVSEWVWRAEGGALRAGARGASWLYPLARLARCSSRLQPPLLYRGPQLGLRLAQDAPR